LTFKKESRTTAILRHIKHLESEIGSLNIVNKDLRDESSGTVSIYIWWLPNDAHKLQEYQAVF
jgi:hypothetical protein